MENKKSIAEEALTSLKECAFVTNDHFVFASGLHGDSYFNKSAISIDTKLVSMVCLAMALSVVKFHPDVVIAPAIGGIALSQWTAYHLSEMSGKKILSVYAEKEGDDRFAIRRGYGKLIAGKKVLVVEDVLTTGSSVKKVIKAVRAAGGNVVATTVILNRGGITADDIDSPKLFSLLELDLNSWPEEDCPLCKKGVPINIEIGKGREFLERMKFQ